MRDYGSVSPHFWIGETGKKLRGKPNAQIVALYLMTSPHANMIGVFHCPLLYVAHETGLTIEQAEEAILELEGFDFCTYERSAEVIFVHSMSAHQVGEGLKADDNKVKGIRKEWDRITVKSLKDAFANRYSKDYHLPTPFEAPSKPLQRVPEPPSKQLTRQEQEQDIEGASPPPSSKRASRLPDDWVLPDEWADWAKSEMGWLRSDVEAEACRFRDYWVSKPGKDAGKLDWQATWRNWCRNSRTPKGRTSSADKYAGATL